VLPARDRGDARIGRVAFVAHVSTKSTGPSDSPPYLLLSLYLAAFWAAERL
jgi:hypothetical protein